MSKCIFCKKQMLNKLEQHIKACNGCIVKVLMKKHNLTIRKPAPPILIKSKMND